MAGTSRLGVGVDSQNRLRAMEEQAELGTPRPYSPGTDQPSMMFNLGLQMANSLANAEVARTQLEAQSILSSQLGQEETQKRIDPLKNKLGLLSLVSPNAGSIAETIQNSAQNKFRAEAEAEDRLNEKMALHGINNAITQALSPEDFLKKTDEYLKLVQSTNKYNVSNDFLASVNAYRNYGNSLIENTRRSTLMGKTGPNFYKASNNEFRANFPRPTLEDIEQHLDGQWEQLKDLKSSALLMSNSIFELMADIGTPEILEGVLSKYGSRLSKQQQSNLTLLAKTRGATKYPPSKKPLHVYTRNRNDHGFGVPLDDSLLEDDPELMEDNILLRDSVNLSKLSPEILKSFANDPTRTPQEIRLAAKTAELIEKEFKQDAELAAIAFGTGVETRQIPMPVLDRKTETVVGVPAFIQSLRNRVEQIGAIKNDWFGGTDAIDNVFNSLEKQEIRQLMDSLSPKQKWGLAEETRRVFESYNKELDKSTNAKKFSTDFNIGDIFGDKELAALLKLQETGEITGGLDLYKRIDTYEKSNPSLVSDTRKKLTEGLIAKGLEDTSANLQAYLLGSALSTGGEVDIAKMGLEVVQTVDGRFLAIAGATNTLFDMQGAGSLSIFKMKEGLVKLVPKQDSFRYAHAYTADTKADAAAGNWILVVDDKFEPAELDLKTGSANTGVVKAEYAGSHSGFRNWLRKSKTEAKGSK